jgi:hypothetical protein
LTPRERAFLAELHLGHEASLDKKDAFRLAAGIFEWHLTPTDVEGFEIEGRDRRRYGGRVPDLHSVSQLLRILGAIVDQKRGRLCCISKNEQVVILEYGLPSGRTTVEEYNIPTLYDFWVRMYKRRAARDGETRLTA